MDFTPIQHLEIGNYIKYINEILHKCDKGIEYCKICPNEFVCSELEKDDFGLNGSTISDILTAIQNALNKVPGYLNPSKRNELKDRIKSHIDESPIHERKIWEDSILSVLLNDKLANPAYKPSAKTGTTRTLLTYNARTSFSTCLKCLCLENEVALHDVAATLPREFFSNSTKAVNQFIQSRPINNLIFPPSTRIKYRLEEGATKITQMCNLNELGLPAALSYYGLLIKSVIPENTIVTGELDNHGKVLQVNSLDSKIETVLRELHFVEKIIIPRDNSINIPVPNSVEIIGVDNLEQTIDVVFKRDTAK